jgi:hypothetical protein
MSLKTSRRHTLALAAIASVLIAAPSFALAQAKLKVAGIYTVPFEQQWAGRLHNALKAAEARGDIEYKASENVSNADYERVMREYATAGNNLIVGEAFAVEAAARKVAKDFPKVSFLMGSSGKPQAPNFSVFDNYIQEPAYLSGMIAGGMTKSNKIGMVGGFPIPEVNRLMNARNTIQAPCPPRPPCLTNTYDRSRLKEGLRFLGTWDTQPTLAIRITAIHHHHPCRAQGALVRTTGLAYQTQLKTPPCLQGQQRSPTTLPNMMT